MQDNLRAQARNLDLFSSDEVAVIGRARGHGLSIGVLLLQCATEADDDARRATGETLGEIIATFSASVHEVLTPALLKRLGSELVPFETTILSYSSRVDALDQTDGFACVTRAEAVAIAEEARLEVLPAIYRVIMMIEEQERQSMVKRQEGTREKAAVLDRMLSEMDEIARSIRLISLNASVEAARAGHEGRTFKVIADEIRSLADRSTTLIETTKDGVSDGGDLLAGQAAMGKGAALAMPDRAPNPHLGTEDLHP